MIAFGAAAFLFKPVALGLALSRPLREAVPALAVGAVCVLLLSPVRLDGLAHPIHHALNLSPWRFLVGVLDLPGWVPLAVVGGLAATWARGHAGRALCAGWALLPVAWPHTSMILLLPWSFALAAAVQRPRRLPVVALAVAFAGIDGPVPMARWLGWLPVAVPSSLLVAATTLATPLCVLLIAWWTEDPPWILADRADGARDGAASPPPPAP